MIVYIRDLVEQGGGVGGGGREEVAAELLVDGDGVLVVVVPDSALCFVESPASHILRHVDAGGEGVFSLNRVFPISPYSGSRVSELKLLEPPFPV